MKLPSKDDLLFFKSLTVMAHPLSDIENNIVASAKYFNLCSIILVNVLLRLGSKLRFLSDGIVIWEVNNNHESAFCRRT
ncbi:hypothetical protein PB70LOC_02181 [Pectobacterium versatile]|nr:Hypothetical protein SCC1_1507 [Pectobacterium versatile]POY55423.1 hypothetical protein F018LOC_01350 [Pectobacterium versatile]POY58827.1 hypothetical protein PB70LOC_02181 [Pectobacterium versatile]POY62190.1 hypothetical protein PB69LOC_02980 [Pectobacterium versatile]